ncbi:MAG: tRNA pseudouridine(55) synthase TruB [Actinomycetota bacterium]
MSDPEGLLLVDKPGGMTSHDVVDVVRRRLGTRKVGHAGTLDPMATGLLVLGVGRATRLLRFLGRLPKTYEGTARLGVQTTTLDADGEITVERPVTATEREIRGAMASLVGDSMQSPPAYSAVKVGGRKLYEAARRGEVLEAAPRPIHVDAFELITLRGPDVDFSVTCSGGTYVRVLLADVGTAVESGAHLTRLRRTAIGALEAIEAVEPERAGSLLPSERAVAHLPRVDLSSEEAIAASHGRILGPNGVPGPYGVFAPDGTFIGVYEDEGTKARPQVILAAST